MAKNSAAGLLTSLDDLFTTQEEREIAAQPRVEDIPIDQIDDFPNHPFKVRMDGAMVRLVESVGQYGVSSVPFGSRFRRNAAKSVSASQKTANETFSAACWSARIVGTT